MKYLGIDYGSKWIGIAISNDEGTIAFPRAVIPNGDTALPFLKRMAEEEEHIRRIIVGDTRALSGAANPVTPGADAFIQALAEATGVPTEPMWEAWSSVEASRYDPKGQGNDAAAAAIILQRYIDMHSGTVE